MQDSHPGICSVSRVYHIHSCYLFDLTKIPMLEEIQPSFCCSLLDSRAVQIFWLKQKLQMGSAVIRFSCRCNISFVISITFRGRVLHLTDPSTWHCQQKHGLTVNKTQSVCSETKNVYIANCPITRPRKEKFNIQRLWSRGQKPQKSLYTFPPSIPFWGFASLPNKLSFANICLWSRVIQQPSVIVRPGSCSEI